MDVQHQSLKNADSHPIGYILPVADFPAPESVASGIGAFDLSTGMLYVSNGVDRWQAYLPMPTGLTRGDVLYFNGVTFARLPAGDTGQVLTAQGAAQDPAWAMPAPGGVTDHGALTGLNDDDHLQYHTDARGDSRYVRRAGNLSDLSDSAAARMHLGLGGAATRSVDQPGGVAGLDADGKVAQARLADQVPWSGVQNPPSTDDIAEGTTHRYYTDARADARITLVKGQPGGLASLGGDGKVPTTQLPTSTGGLTKLEDDPAPTLGAHLHLNGKQLLGAGEITGILKGPQFYNTTVDWGQIGGGSLLLSFDGGLVQQVTITGTPSALFSELAAGKKLILVVIQGPGGGNTITWPVGVKWPNGTAPTITSLGGKTDIFGFLTDGISIYGQIYGQNY